MSARTTYLVAYDVGDSKRLRKVHKTMCGYGDAVQFSVFQCTLTASQRELMLTDLSEIIHHMQDRILIVDLGPEDGRARRAISVLGRQPLPPEHGPVVL